MTELSECVNCGKEIENPIDDLCKDCYRAKNEGPCGCFTELKRFK